MKTYFLSIALLFLVFFNNMTQCAQSIWIYPYSDSDPGIQLNAQVTQLNLIQYDSNKFTYSMEYMRDKENKKSELKIEVPYYIPPYRNQNLVLKVFGYDEIGSETSRQILLDCEALIQEKVCIRHLDQLDKKIDNPLYAQEYFLASKYFCPVKCLKSIFRGVCPSKGYAIYEVYYDPLSQYNLNCAEGLSNPFCMFSEKLIYKNNSSLFLKADVNKSSAFYVLSVSNLKRYIFDYKKALIAQLVLQAYLIQKNYHLDILKSIIPFVYKTFVREN